MKKTTDLANQRIALKQEVTELIENTFPARVLHGTGTAIQKATRLRTPPPWWISAVILGFVVNSPATFVTIITKQPIGFYLFSLISDITVVLFAALFYPMTKYILKGIHNHIIDNLEESQELDEFRAFLYQTQAHLKILIHALIISVIWLAIWIPSSIELIPGFKNGYFFLGVWTAGFIGVGLTSYFLIWIMQFPHQIGKYRFKLYELNPSQSEVLVRLSGLFSRPFWALVLLLAIGIVVGGLTQWPFWVIVAIQGGFWILLIIQFVNSRAAINRIIAAQKWQTLNALQAQIHELKRSIASNTVQTSEAINTLMDLHERVYNAGNRQLTVISALDFLNQLILPLIAFLIANYKDVLAFFNR